MQTKISYITNSYNYNISFNKRTEKTDYAEDINL